MNADEKEDIVRKINTIYDLKENVLAPAFFDTILDLIKTVKEQLIQICETVEYPYLDIDTIFLIELEKNMNIYVKDESPEVKALCKRRIYFLIESNLNYWAF